MIDWLGNHAPAVQALASLAMLATTVVLAALTARYVGLTRKLAQSTAEQVALERDAANEERKQATHALRSLASRLHAALQEMTPPVPTHRALARFSLITEDDIGTLEVLAQRVGGHQMKAAIIAVALRGILGLCLEAAAADENRGWAPTGMETRGYAISREKALAELQSLLDALPMTAERDAAR